MGIPCPNTYGDTRAGSPRRAVFLDRDGVLIEDTGFPGDPSRIHLLPGVTEALRLLREDGWALVVVSNQSGIARGKFTLERLAQIHDRLRALLEAERVELDALYFCPHHPAASEAEFAVACDHRKPNAGMLRSAAEALGVDLLRSWMVGDKESDVQAGHAAGCKAVLIGVRPSAAEASAHDLLDAARQIIASGPTAGRLPDD